MIVIINYALLWKTMKEKGVSQCRLLKSGINNRTLNSLKQKNNCQILRVSGS